MSTCRVVFQVPMATHGDGLDFATKRSSGEPGVRAALESGVEFWAYHNTLQRKGIAADELLSGVRTVRAGLAEIVRLQHDVWAYVHP